MSTATGTNKGPGKPGPTLGPIVKTATLSHRQWLEPLRQAYFASGLSTEEIYEKSRERLTSKGKVSKLLRGPEDYARWYRVLALYEVLSPPVDKDFIKDKWIEGAVAVGRSPFWTTKCFAEVKAEANTGDLQPSRGSNRRISLSLKTQMTVSIASAVLALLAGLMGFFDSGPQVNQRQSRDSQRCIDWTCRVEPGDDGLGADRPGEPEYVDLPTPTDTRGLLKVTPGSDIWVYSVGDSTSWGWIEAGDTFFVRCRTYAPRSDALIIA
ncbi:hypothetical protein GCM10010304_82640 [Streptomyces roseoviolaceus]